MLRYLKIALLFSVPIVLLCLPSDFFDSGQSMCPSKYFLDKECLGCGITRGVQHGVHLEFSEAWAYNKLTFIVLPIGVFMWMSYFYKWVLNKSLLVAIKELLKGKK